MQKKKASAQNLQILYKMFPPLTGSNEKETTKKGRSKNIHMRKTENPYRLKKNRNILRKILK